MLSAILWVNKGRDCEGIHPVLSHSLPRSHSDTTTEASRYSQANHGIINHASPEWALLDDARSNHY